MTRFKAALKVILSLCAVTVTICAVIATLWLYQSDLGEVKHAYPEQPAEQSAEQAEQSVEQGEEAAISPTWLYEAKLERAEEERVCSKLLDHKNELDRLLGKWESGWRASGGGVRGPYVHDILSRGWTEMERIDVIELEYDIRDCEWILKGRP